MNIGVEECMVTFRERVNRYTAPVYGRARVITDEPLPALQRALLRYFRDHPGRILSRDELAEKVWQQRYFYGSRAIDQAVANLRKKLRPEEGRIRSIYAAGYCFESDSPHRLMTERLLS